LEESKLWRCLREIASDYIRWGCGMAYRMLRGEGWTLNQSAGVTALAEGRLAASYSQEAKVVTARSRRGEVCVGPASPQVGAMDFQCAEHSRFCFAIRVGRRCQAKDVVAVLAELTSLHPSSGGSDPG